MNIDFRSFKTWFIQHLNYRNFGSLPTIRIQDFRSFKTRLIEDAVQRNFGSLLPKEIMMKTFILPILPGKIEAWRRFLQELQGSRREMFAAWCAALKVQHLKISVWESRSGAAMVVSFEEGADEPISQEADCDAPFVRWLREQLVALHGLDLFALMGGTAPTVLLEA